MLEEETMRMMHRNNFPFENIDLCFGAVALEQRGDGSILGKLISWQTSDRLRDM